jgi:hypothetical protein
MAKRIMMVTGVDGQIELLNDRVIIHRSGVWNMLKYGFNSTREIPLGAISEVAFKESSPLWIGYIEFIRSGRAADELKKKNYSKVTFRKVQNEEFRKLKEKTFELLDQYARQRQ